MPTLPQHESLEILLHLREAAECLRAARHPSNKVRDYDMTIAASSVEIAQRMMGMPHAINAFYSVTVPEISRAFTKTVAQFRTMKPPAI